MPALNRNQGGGEEEEVDYGGTILTRVCSLEAMETDDAVQDHVNCDGIRSKVASSTRWLTHRIHRIDNGVRNPADGHDTNQHHGDHRIGVGQHVQQRHDHKRNNVLQVVQMCPANTFHQSVLLPNLYPFRSVLWVLKGLESLNSLIPHTLITFRN